ncbi:ABC transporter substrate-binding protein [Pseudonocardia adelaidensis]|uniref:ABC transporter substrate-binding protein n=1 Tax=Pseudonocardia adelaidensis TaxID=648754 RepID=A0ABP9NDX8_9PSEU
MVFRIQPHVRLHEWVAQERGFFTDEGLAYEFDAGFAGGSAPGVSAASAAPLQVRTGAFEDMEAGRSSDVSCACHWAVNAAATAQHGKMYGRAYSVCPSGIYVAADSSLRAPADLAGVEVGVGYHSGSHYSALQALEAFLPREQVTLGFYGFPFDRTRLLLEGKVPAVNAWGASAYVLEQRGFRKLVDTTFVMGFLLAAEVDAEDAERYFRALLRAQQEIDLEPHRYTRHWARELPADLLELVDVRRFGPGERIVPQPYTREMFDRTQGWMREWELLDVAAPVRYEAAVLR